MAKMGRPKKNDSNSFSLNVRINDQLLAKVNEYSEKNKVSKGEIVRKALELFFDGIKK